MIYISLFEILLHIYVLIKPWRSYAFNCLSLTPLLIHMLPISLSLSWFGFVPSQRTKVFNSTRSCLSFVIKEEGIEESF